MSKYAEVLFNIARLLILGTVAARPDSDANYIINTTGISQSKVYRDLKTLIDAKLITTTEIQTGAGYKKMTYRAKYNTVSLVMHQDKIRLDLRMS